MTPKCREAQANSPPRLPADRMSSSEVLFMSLLRWSVSPADGIAKSACNVSQQAVRRAIGARKDP
jgi:hypothetical protein